MLLCAKNQNHRCSDHPLYYVWYRMSIHYDRKDVCERWWRIENFVDDVKEKKKGYRFTRIDKNRPWGPDNFIWVETKAKTNIKNRNVATGKTVKNKRIYVIWHNMLKNYNDNVYDEWRDFNVFFKDVGEKDGSYRFVRKDINKPWGPDNFIWTKAKTRTHVEKSEYKDGITVKNKELYVLWYNKISKYKTDNIYDEWRDFSNFVKDVKEKKEGHRFSILDKTKPLGPDNYYWKPVSKSLFKR